MVVREIVLAIPAVGRSAASITHNPAFRSSLTCTEERSGGAYGFATSISPCYKFRFVAYEAPATKRLAAIRSRDAEWAGEVKLLVHTDLVAGTYTIVGHLTFKQRLVAHLARNLEEVVEVRIKLKATIFDDIVGEFFHLFIVALKEIGMYYVEMKLSLMID